MERMLTALVALVALGCGDDSSSGGSTSAAPSPPPSQGTGGSGGTAGTFAKSTTVSGVARTYTLYAPSAAITAQATAPVPLVIAFHGAGDTGSNFITATGLKTIASSNAFLLVGADAYPGNGGVRGWFLSTAEGWPGTGGTSSSLSNDCSFTLALKNEVGALYDVDTRRLFACGFSRGAGFTGALATVSGNPGMIGGSFASPFAAYGVCAGYDIFGGGLNFANSNPKRPVWLIHGTSDGAVAYSQGQSFSNSLAAAGYPAMLTSISGAPHNWLWSASFGHSNQELVDYFLANPLP